MSEEDAAPSTVRATVRCLVCGQGDVFYGEDARDAECPRCKALIGSMHLAAMLIAESVGGAAPTLSHLVQGGGLGARKVLDFTGDPVVSKVLGTYRGYQAVGLLETTPGGASRFGAALLKRLGAIANGSADLALFRGVLRLVPSLDALIDEIRRIVRPGASVILQDRFSWPFPERTEEVSHPNEYQSVFRDAPETLYGFEEVHVPVCRHIGADIMDLLHAHGFDAYVDRPLVFLASSYRLMGIVVQVP